MKFSPHSPIIPFIQAALYYGAGIGPIFQYHTGGFAPKQILFS